MEDGPQVSPALREVRQRRAAELLSKFVDTSSTYPRVHVELQQQCETDETASKVPSQNQQQQSSGDGWVAHSILDGKTYYVNRITKQTSWENPNEVADARQKHEVANKSDEPASAEE